ncbi:MAG TPA: hypothetical protein PKA16_01500 [Ottowia sp.]|mgnify:CR=1 FL=1|uniref:hypothetical protein n=1 Tax=Ottowia sp. TaxID=1898956 RepID=UPI002CB4291B|nr:hypothetical protein [Ottowia sp.]HMN20046.1 hypothetical protein [Ottowia sp.]
MNRLHAEAVLGAGLLALLALPAVRHGMEASMWRHMLLQAPAWLLAGALLAAALPVRARAACARWNRHGISGLLASALVLTLLMVPRVLDLALVRMDVEAVKLLALLLAGVALRLSWRPAGLVLQFFFLGNLLGMMVVVGQLYIDSPLRLCNAYLLDDQERLGRWLIGVAAVLALAWLAHAFWGLVRSEEAARQAESAASRPADGRSITRRA